MSVSQPADDAGIRRLGELAFAAGNAAAIQTATRLKIPDLIDDKPVPVEELAQKTGLDPHLLYRLLRALTTYGVFEEVGERTFAHTEVSLPLREDSPDGIRNLILWIGAPWTWQAWPRLEEALRTGKSVIPGVYGKEFYDYLREDAPDDEQLFARAMTDSSARSSHVVAQTLDLSGVGRVVDIGGGQGLLLRSLLDRFPDLRGALFDFEQVVAGAHEDLKDGGRLASRTSVVPGNCLESVPVEADVYILKNLLDWPDESSRTVLRNITASAPRGARVIIIDSLVDAHPDEMRITTTLDLFLLMNVGGQKHGLAGFDKLFAETGIETLSVQTVPGTLPLLHIVEGGLHRG
ncbi:methyltransferase [Streptomyces sp. HUCO-GS316]|uniref:methyltransferase n=1 Tax=Streptomyces sp. HUCO-GS316 TaxID=2692198 RepID=UPI001368D291|nr:methyltransferase [Streptomyces sp. HUCO-GS316]MXM65369.1 methyltransferase [Streptomyces sp. HUCO-GS316]